MLVPKQQRDNKLSPVSTRGKLLGHEAGGAGNRVLTDIGKFVRSSNVTFAKPAAPVKHVTFDCPDSDSDDDGSPPLV